MSFLKAPPLPSDVPVAADLRVKPSYSDLHELFIRAQADWKTAKAEVPSRIRLCGKSSKKEPQKKEPDMWLALQFPDQIRKLAQKLPLTDYQRGELYKHLSESKLSTASIERLKLPNDRDIRRRYAEQYFKPIFNEDAFLVWFQQMLSPDNNFPYMLLIDPKNARDLPTGVYEEEKRSDEELFNRWIGVPPLSPSLADAKARKKYEADIKKYEKEKEQKLRALQGGKGIYINNELLPPNLFLYDVEPIVQEYLKLLDEVFSPAYHETDSRLRWMFDNTAYGILTLALVPLHCLYDKYYGTYTIEDVIPRLDKTLSKLESYINNNLKNIFWMHLGDRMRTEKTDIFVDRAISILKLMDIFIEWAISILKGIRQSYYGLLRLAGQQSNGRISLPKSFTENRKWQFKIQEKQADGSMKEKELEFGEYIEYKDRTDKKGRINPDKEEVFWILREAWYPLATAVALVNQANMTAWFNAGNNRWGGHHPPHQGHRQGNGLDFDAEFNGKMVPNVRARMTDYHCIMDDLVVKDNSRNPLCLHGIWRVLGWAAVQAFILAGLNKYLYGDVGIIIESAQHLGSEFDMNLREYDEWELFNEKDTSSQKRIEKRLSKAKRLGIEETQVHYHHWHFDLFIGQHTSGQSPYVWKVENIDLLDRLYELAIARDQDIRFWKAMTGLEKVPEYHEDFDNVLTGDSEDWKVWWELRKNSIPLLPVWSRNSQLIEDTLKYDKCMQSKCLIDKYIEDLGIPKYL